MAEAPGNSSASSQVTEFDVSPLVTVLQLSNQVLSKVATGITSQFPAQSATRSQLAISNSSAGGTLVKAGAGYLMSVSVTTPSTGAVAGQLYDSASVANSTHTNVFALIPSSGIQTYNWPFANGLVVQPSSISTQVVSVSYI